MRSRADRTGHRPALRGDRYQGSVGAAESGGRLRLFVVFELIELVGVFDKLRSDVWRQATPDEADEAVGGHRHDWIFRPPR